MNIGTSLYLYLPWAKGAILAVVLLYMFKKLWNCYKWYDEKENEIKLDDIKNLEKTNKKIIREAKKGAAALVVAMLVVFTLFFSFGQGKKSTVKIKPSGQMEALENAPEKEVVESKSVFTTPNVNVEAAANQAALEKEEEENRKYLENLTKEKE